MDSYPGLLAPGVIGWQGMSFISFQGVLNTSSDAYIPAVPETEEAM